METQDHKITTPSGHENHGTHLCHKCSWPFPNPHPSARHRRAHKKVCGKVEGYKLSESEAGNSTHSAVSDDEHHSDGDQQTPSPIGKKVSVKDGSSSDKSYRSEDKTFSDAVTEFSDSGISPGMEENPEGVKGLNTNVRKIDDGLLKADALGGISVSFNDDRRTAEVNDPKSLESATNQPVADKFSDSSKAEEEERDALLHFLEEVNAESAAWVVVNMKSDQLPQQPILSSAGKPVPADVISIGKQKNYQLIIKKTLCRSDIEPKKARFTMPVRKILLDNFLSQAEQVLLAKGSLIIELTNVQGVSHQVDWKVYKSGVANLDTNVLTGNQWELVVQENDFKVGDVVELWRCWDSSSVVYVVKKSQEEVAVDPQEAAHE